MNDATLRKQLAVGVVIALCLAWLTPAHSQTISGQIRNSSLWHENIAAPPGNFDGAGQMMLGLWTAEAGKFSAPIAASTVTNGLLPFDYGPYSFSIGGVSTGSYVVAAWIDGNTNGMVDPGEPFGEAAVVMAAAPVIGVILAILDDNDGDSLPDWWEYHWFRFTPSPFGYSGGDDADGDGLSNQQEYDISFNISGMEYMNPGNWDTDGDNIDDYWETKYYSRDYGVGMNACTNDASVDLDGDGLSNWQEYCGIDGIPRMQSLQFVNGIYKGTLNSQSSDDLNPLDIDTDFDLLIDSFEAAWYDPVDKINPKGSSYQPNFTNITTEVAITDPDLDGLTTYREQCLLNEFHQGSANGDKWVWENRFPFPFHTYYNIESKLTRICFMSYSGTNLNLGLNPAQAVATSGNRAALRAHEWTDPTEGTGYDFMDEDIPPGHDTDDDWLPDGWEVEFNLDPRNDGMDGSWDDGPFGDPDDDGLLNIEEYFGQDGNRSTTRPCVNGTGDETNPYQYNHRPDSTYTWRWYPTNILVNAMTDPRTGTGINRVETMGSALPSLTLGIPDSGNDTDDDGIPDDLEMSPTNNLPISCPVNSCDPFIPRSILVTSSNGIAIPDPEPAGVNGIAPAGNREDLQRRDWTIECYVKLLGTNMTGDLIHFRTAAGPVGRTIYRISLSNNIPGIVSQNDAGSIKSVTANALPTNRWIHLAAVWDHGKNSLGLYVGGVLYMSTSPVGECFSRFMFPATNVLALAVSPNGSFVNRLMLDEFRIWGVPRSATQIADFANRLVPPHNGDDVWLNTESTEYYTHADTIIVNGGSLFDGEPGIPLANVCSSAGNYWIDDGDKQYNAAKDVLLRNDGSLKEGLAGATVANMFWNDKDGDGVFSRTSVLAYYRFDDGGSTAEDFARRAKSGLLGSTAEEYQFGDRGYALPTNNFVFVINDVAPVYGVDKRGADDSDGDGMPDAWEMVWHLDPWDNGTKNESATGMQDGPGGPNGDPDSDGLLNLYEFWAGTNPQSEDSDGNGILDPQEDRDHDGVLNSIEQQLRSRPDMVDTDDDSYPDNVEQGMGSSPAEPTDPSKSCAVVLGGSPDDYLDVPLSTRQRLTDWTIEAWVNPSNAVDGAGIIIRRVVQDLTNGMAVNYVMGLETNGAALRLYAGYVWPDGRRFILSGGNVPATGSWTHVAARYNGLGAQLNLYTNGGMAAGTNTFYDAPPTSGKGGNCFLRLGEDFAGALDEVRLWASVRDEGQILSGISRVVAGADIGALALYFRFDDGEADTNMFAWSEFHQPGGLQDFTYSDDWNEQWRHAAIRHGNVGIISPGAIVSPPSLRVMLSPEAAKSAGAQWAIDGGTWQNSGDTIQGLVPGEHTLIFKSIVGWTEPASEVITLTNGTATTLARAYQQQATLTINIEPLAARATGQATWRVDGGPWLESGTTSSNLNPGAHTLEFSSADGWIPPPLETVVLSAGQFLTLTRLYSVMYGAVSSTIIPLGAITDGAQWRVDGGTWMNSGDVVPNLALTTHSIDYRSIPMWHTPPSTTITPTNQQTIMLTGAYVQVTGLYVGIEPVTAVNDGALWRLGSGPWTNAGTFIELAPGTYTVSFSPVSGWLTPDNITAVVVSQAVTTVMGSYYRLDVFGGDPGTAAGQFIGPRGVAIDSLHRLYVADSLNNRVQKYDPMSNTWTNWGLLGTNAGQFNIPGGVAVDASANVFVADSNNNRIQKRTATNGQWVVWGTYGTNTGRFIGPSDVAVDSAGNIYVADLYNNRVQKRGTNGAWSVFIPYGAANGFVRAPKGLFVDTSDNLYVSDDGTQTNGSSRIQKFSKTGAFIGVLGSAQTSGGRLKRPGGMVIGGTNLYVADIDNSRVAASSTTGSWTTILGSNILDHAEDVTWDARGFLYVADTGNDRILRLPVIPGAETNFIVPFSGVMSPGPGTNSAFTVTWYGILNWYYAVQYANTLGDPWQALPGCINIAGQNMVTNCSDYTAGGVTSRFYRVIAY